MALPATEAFGAVAGNLPNPPWTQQRTTRRVNTDGSGHGLQDADDAAGDVLAFWNADSFNADQYGQIQINTLVVGGGGCSANASVRASGSGDAAWNAYDWYTNLVSGAGNTELAKVVSGVATVLRNYATTFAVGDTARLEVAGQVLTAYKNGVSIGTQSDAALSFGSPGCGTFRNGATVTIDNFQGDNLVAAASTGRRLVNPRRWSPFTRLRRLSAGTPGPMQRRWTGDAGAVTTPVASADGLTLYESLLEVTLVPVVPDESLLSASNTQVVPEESLGSTSNSQIVIEESLLQVTLGQAVIEESLLQVTLGQAVIEEALGSTSNSAVVQDESLGSVSAGQAVQDESLGSIALAPVVQDEALGGIALGQTVQYESLGLTAVSNSLVVIYEALASVSTSQVAQDEALGSVSTVQAVIDEALATALLAQAVIEEALGSVAATPTVQYESGGVVTTPVSNSVTVALEALQQVGPTQAVVMEAAGLVAQAQTAALESLGVVSVLQVALTESLGSVSAQTIARLEALTTALAGLLVALESGGSALVILARMQRRTSATQEINRTDSRSGGVDGSARGVGVDRDERWLTHEIVRDNAPDKKVRP